MKLIIIIFAIFAIFAAVLADNSSYITDFGGPGLYNIFLKKTVVRVQFLH